MNDNREGEKGKQKRGNGEKKQINRVDKQINNRARRNRLQRERENNGIGEENENWAG